MNTSNIPSQVGAKCHIYRQGMGIGEEDPSRTRCLQGWFWVEFLNRTVPLICNKLDGRVYKFSSIHIYFVPL